MTCRLDRTTSLVVLSAKTMVVVVEQSVTSSYLFQAHFCTEPAKSDITNRWSAIIGHD